MPEQTRHASSFIRRKARVWALALVVATFFVLLVPHAAAQPPPVVIGQGGKDVPWVPTPDELVDTMLEMAHVTPNDVVIDLGSGDGRTVIAAAKLGARAVGVELEENLVELSKQRAAEAGVADRASFLATDLFEFDLSPATVITMFLLPDINLRIRPTLLGLEPGTRIVSNTWDLGGSQRDPDAPGWTPDQTVQLDPCPSFCTSLLWIVPAKVAGPWQMSNGELQLEQEFQMVTGRMRADGRSAEIEEGRLSGTAITFRVGDTHYSGMISNDTMRGIARTRDDRDDPVDWSATLTR